MAFADLPTGKEDLNDDEESSISAVSTASDPHKWAENVHDNQIAGTPVHQMHSMRPQAVGAGGIPSPKRSGRKEASSRWSWSSISTWLFLLVVHDLGLICLCLWIFNRQDSDEIPWKWLGFTDED